MLFQLLLGDKYSPMKLPVSLSPEDFITLKLTGDEEHLGDTWLLDSWYKLDADANPPVYILQVNNPPVYILQVNNMQDHMCT